MSLLTVTDLCAGYGNAKVLHDVHLTVEVGEIVVLLGANGAGKTTLMRSISGTISRSGSVRLDGRETTTSAPDEIVRHGVGHVPQGRGTFASLSVDDNLRGGAITRRDRHVADDLARWYETFPVLEQRRRQAAGTLSGGEQQMLAVARAMMGRPRVLLLDEPSLGLAPIVTQRVFAQLADLSRSQEVAVLLVEQNANLALAVAERVYLLETGRVVRCGSPAEMERDGAVRLAYLGG